MKDYFVLLVLMISLFTACSSEMNGDENNRKEDVVSLSFSLLDINGTPCNEFAYGDPIIFDLEIDNKKNKPIILFHSDKDAVDLQLGSDLFKVYSEEDKREMGTPWSGMFCEYSLAPISLPASTQSHLYCSWFGVNEDNKYRCSYPLCKDADNVPLPKGSYFVRFSIECSQNAPRTSSFSIPFKVK